MGLAAVPPVAPAETADRFLQEIASRLGADRVSEMYLFPPLRQGYLESAVAVVAVNPDIAVPSTLAPELAADAPPAPEPPTRFGVYTATYRYVRKGPERGTWSMDLKAEADAPLDAVAAVVRGVQRRAADGAEADAERLTADAFRERIGAAAPAPPAASPASPPAAASE